MAKIKISKETAVPTGSSIAADTLYLISVGGDKMETYMSNKAGTALRRMLNRSDVQALIDAAVAGASAIEIVDDIPARDALTLTANTMVIVEDASADTTVNAGAALYGYKHSNTSFKKLSEFESMDVILNWNNIQGKPTSTTAQIDAAVTAAHGHTNKTQIDLIGQDAEGDVTYNGSKIANEYISTAW